MSFEDSLRAELLEFVRANHDSGAVAVLSWEDDTENDGYCETCWYEYAVVNITYSDGSEFNREYQYRGSFAELIRQLTNGNYTEVVDDDGTVS